MLQGEGEAGEGGEKETLEGGSHFYPRVFCEVLLCPADLANHKMWLVADMASVVSNMVVLELAGRKGEGS
ncbi:hypothetical protein FCM35_KLT10131 [Carex littledalei]|uniref:Uncharacterized protein n=1 Tax=Carex littledalei TaxID=544730 RepID=A0A833RKR3_9POAL|nr:hypothetical protein FCM35_KLT10131 [Carex littledalei]